MDKINDYETINKKMMEYIGKGGEFGVTVLTWYSEFGKVNYDWCKIIITCLYTNDEPFNKDYENKEEKLIRDTAQKIYDRGGMEALIGNFYVMSNFMCKEIDHIHKLHISNLNDILSGIGEWI